MVVEGQLELPPLVLVSFILCSCRNFEEGSKALPSPKSELLARRIFCLIKFRRALVDETEGFS